MSHGFSTAVLAGGLSRRFGAPKALADWGGRGLAESVCLALAPVSPERLLVARELGAFEGAEKDGLRLVPDLFESAHPMGGIATALRASLSPWCFVAACDMPFLNADLVRALWHRRGPGAAIVPVWAGRAQGLCAFYRRDALPVLEGRIARGELRLSEAIEALAPSKVDGASLDPSGRAFLDIDTPEDYRLLKALPC
ncbi:MAG: molybdenum cofactor guanylyltransferase [Elusimicrobia bacterium]|nr:molybdenum cofactor guanylyltransferase [Elusimicrobiota bacterium]